MTTARVTKFKLIMVFHADVENLESNYNCKEPLLTKVSSSIHCKRPTLNDDSSSYITYSPQTFKIRPKENILLDLQIKIEIPKHINWTIVHQKIISREFKRNCQNERQLYCFRYTSQRF